MLRHIDQIKELKTRPRPINITIALTSKCTQNCEFCYVKNRAPGELNYSKLINFLKVVRPKSVDLAGGEPTIYPYINELIDWCYDEGIKVGLITNGSRLDNVRISNLNKLSFLRISINEYVDKYDKVLKIPELNDSVYTGFIYVWHKDSKPHIDTFLNMRPMYPQIKYIKVVGDFLYPYIKVPKWFKQWGEPFIVEDTIPKKHVKRVCYIGWLKPLLDADGKVYFCTGNIHPDKKRKDEGTEFCTIDEPEKLLNYVEVWKDCKSCEAYSKNEFLDYLFDEKVPHEEFI